MKVKELIEKLQKCNPNSTVYVEANNIPNANVVQEYYSPNDNSSFVYIADDTEYVDRVLEDAIKFEEV